MSLADDMPKSQSATETAKTQSVTEPKTKPKAQKSLQRKSVERSADTKAVDTKTGVVIAPAKPSLKQSPSKELEKSEGSGDLAAEHGATQKEGSEEKRRRVPGVLSFIANDTSLLQETMTSLNQNCKFLLENPSTSLVLQGTHSGDEPRSLIDARFESIKAYMVGKGVPEDQIRLDEEKRRGASEFKLFVIEH
jgi:outer membrane protein OmpA-like peptidoglycan-associated protein